MYAEQGAGRHAHQLYNHSLLSSVQDWTQLKMGAPLSLRRRTMPVLAPQITTAIDVRLPQKLGF
jgi:hypothetical protein